jgi:hypothetical protein
VHELAGEVLEEPETPAVLLAQLNELLRPRNED